MDEIGFGPRRDARRPSRRLRGFAAAALIAGAAAAAIAVAVTAEGAQRATTSPPTATATATATATEPAALAAPVLRPLSAVCRPAQSAWPSLANLPAQMHAGAAAIVIDEQFSGRCPSR